MLTLPQLERHLFANPYFPADALFTLRSRTDDSVVGLGMLVLDPTYAVAFAARELWGEAGDDRAVVHVDLWERYLERDE